MKNLKVAVLFFAVAALIITVRTLHAEEEKAFFFDGENDFIDCPHIPFDEYKEFTVEVWVKNWTGYILSQGAVGDPENSVWLSYAYGGADGCGWEANEGRPNYFILAKKLIVNQWTHLALVYDGKTQYLFSDGILIEKQDVPKPGPLTKTRNFIIGGEPRSNPAYPWASGTGYLKSIKISNKARYKTDFSPETELKSDSKTVLLFTFASVKDDVAFDLSKKENNGAMRGASLRSVDEVVPAILTGFAKNENGEILDNCDITLMGSDKNIVVNTGRDGRYTFIINLPEDEYSLFADRDDLLAEEKGIHLNEGKEVTKDIKLMPSNFEKFRWIRYFEGNWINKKTTKSGKKRIIKVSFEWLLNRNIMEYSVCGLLDGQTFYRSEGDFSWNAEKKFVESELWTRSGNKFYGLVDFKQNYTLVRNFKKMTATGEISDAPDSFWMTDINTIFVQDGKIDADGNFEGTDEAIELKRVEK